MTVAQLESTMGYPEFLGWVQFFAQQHEGPAEPEPLDLTAASPDAVRAMFAGL